MAANNKRVTLDVAVKTQVDKALDETERKVNNLKQQKIQMKFEADTQALDAATQKVKEAETKLYDLKVRVDVDDAEVEAAENELEQLKKEQIDIQLQVEEYKLDELQSKKDAIEADEINVQLNNQSAMQGLEQIADGFSRIKNSAMEVGQQFGNLLASAGKQETNFKFLENAVGNAELARQKMSEINQIVAQLPGDDTALQGLLSSAAAKDSSLTADNLRSMANSATDYFSAMSYYGKSATEAQQDMTNYLLAGNTAELERSPILQGHIDKLKEATTVQERSKALAEALNEEHWGGMGAMDTYNNKLETFNGMIERGRYTLGGMFQEGAKGAMDFLLKLDENTNGLVGMTIAASSFASPVTDAVIGLGQIATGINAIKETKIAEWASNAKDKLSGIGDAIKNINFTEKFQALSNSLRNLVLDAKSVATSIGSTLWTAIKNAGNAARTAATQIGKSLWSALKTVGSAAKTAAVEMGKFTVKLIKSGVEAMIAAGRWLIAKAALVAERTATMLAAGAQAFLNLVMSMNPIILVVTAIIALIAVLGYLYYTNEDVRNAIDGLGQALWGIGETIYGSLQGALEWLQGAWQNTIDWFNNGAQSISDNVTGAFNWLSSNVTGTFNWLSNTLNGAWQNTVDFFVNGATSISDAVIGAFDYINGAWQNTVDWLTTGAQTISDNVTGAFQWLTDSFNQVVNFFQTYGQLIAEILFTMATGGIGAIALLIGNMNGMPTKIGSILQNVINRILNFITSMVSNFTNGASNAVNNFMNKIRQMPSEFASELQEMIQKAIDFATHLPQILYEAGANAVSNFLNGLGRHSPGIMQRETVAELTEIAERIPGLIDLIGGNLTLIGDKAGEFVSQVQSQIESGMPATEAVITTGMDWIVNGVAQMINMLGGNGDMFISVWNYMRDGALNALNGLIINVSTLPSRIIGYLNNVIGTVSNFAANFANRFYVAASNALNNFMNPVRQIYSSLKGEIDKMLNIARGFADTIANIFRKAGEQMQQMWKWGSGEHSPGLMYDALFGELKAMEAIAKATIIPKLILDASRDMVSNWGNPNLKYSMELTDIKTTGNTSNSDNQSIIELLNKILSILSATGNNGSITFNHYGDTDDEEKLQRILDFIVREINWNNETAGRDTSKYGV